MSKGTGASRGGVFSVREVEYLNALPAVKHVINGRIIYTDAFKRDCMRRYYLGESPTAIFREAGLDSALIGNKRIERCIARWKRSIPRADTTETGATVTEPSASVAKSKVPAAEAGCLGRQLQESQESSSDFAPRESVSAYGFVASEDRRHVYLDDAVDRTPIAPGNIFNGVAQLVIAQQARRIDSLERTVDMLSSHRTQTSLHSAQTTSYGSQVSANSGSSHNTSPRNMSSSYASPVNTSSNNVTPRNKSPRNVSHFSWE